MLLEFTLTFPGFGLDAMRRRTQRICMKAASAAPQHPLHTAEHGRGSKWHTGRGRGRSVIGVAAGFSIAARFGQAGLAGPAAAGGPFAACAGAPLADHASVSRCSSSSRFLVGGAKPLRQPRAQHSKSSTRQSLFTVTYYTYLLTAGRELDGEPQVALLHSSKRCITWQAAPLL